MSPDTFEGLASLPHTVGSDVGSNEAVSGTSDQDKPLGMAAPSAWPDPETHHQAQILAQCSGWSVPVVCGTTEEVPVELQSQECAWDLPKLKRYSVGVAPCAVDGLRTR